VYELEAPDIDGIAQGLKLGFDELIQDVQIWTLDDSGFHAALERQTTMGADKELARAACIRNARVHEPLMSAFPFKLNSTISGAFLVKFVDKPTNKVFASIEQYITDQTHMLLSALSIRRLALLSGEAAQADWVGRALQLAHSLETASNERSVYGGIHKALSYVMYTENIYFATVDEEKKYFYLDYFIDPSEDSPPPIPIREGLLKGAFTAYVITSGRIIRGSFDEISSQMGSTEELHYGPKSTDWLGVPMMVGDEVIGVIVVQSYEPEITFKDSDPVILAMLADALASSIYRKRMRKSLERMVTERTTELANTNEKLEQSIVQLQATQAQLIEAEKQASLGRLVTGLAHEINTPLGICITGSSLISHLGDDLYTKINSNSLKKQDLLNDITEIKESSALIKSGLTRTANLVKRFKELSIEQDAENLNSFKLRPLLEEVYLVFKPNLDSHNVILAINCDQALTLSSYPSALFRVIQQLIENALQHAFTGREKGTIDIDAEQKDDTIEITVRDNGVGIPNDIAVKAFDPFTTTNRGDNNLGIGLHLVFNTTTQKIDGQIKILPNDTGFSIQLVIPSQS